MEHILGPEWSIHPAGGTSGEAYVAKSPEEKLFLKRNSSPFLAILSAEGIVPKLMWTKRLANGDVITAQKWLEGRVLRKSEMKSNLVTEMLSKIHHSTEILDLFMRMGKEPFEPSGLLFNLMKRCEQLELMDRSFITETLEYLSSSLKYVENQSKVVCHADINHENCLYAEDENLYLIDWDQAVIADPAMDLSMILDQYVPREQWGSWLKEYGHDMTENLLERIRWYKLAHSISNYIWHLERKQLEKLNEVEENLKRQTNITA
ncbi:phosphotransferase [Halalkalibacillus sediminis]|uniref:Phosphotransferase n=1 Tax=Halalkalibacillus sediminis TaxID=2018042 RepID=A0A2I0QYB9_9BACI|nr:phosphotransferase family protein [Halalkalibacillus sediminis]PKR79332.1 phosphotransferase [Halalkalibacillus sediminis]